MPNDFVVQIITRMILKSALLYIEKLFVEKNYLEDYRSVTAILNDIIKINVHFADSMLPFNYQRVYVTYVTS